MTKFARLKKKIKCAKKNYRDRNCVFINIRKLSLYLFEKRRCFLPFWVVVVSNSEKVPLFSDLQERIGFKVWVSGQMGFEQRGRQWRWCVVVLMGMIAMKYVNASDSHTKQEQLVSRIAFGSCSNQTAPQVPLFSFLFHFFLLLIFFLSSFCFTHVAMSFIGGAIR